MSDTWRDRLASGRVLLLDGGTGSELRRRGYALDRLAWSAPAALTDFELLRSIQFDYVAAGADVISTNTFAATRFVLEAAGLGERTVEVVERAVAAAREARAASGRDVAIAGSMSCLPPHGDARAYPDARSESAAYRELAEQLAGEGVDLIALEMLEDMEHAARACEAARDTGLPVWLGVSCRLSDDGALVAFDFPETPFARVLDALLPFAPDAVNVMHSPPGAVAPALRAIRARSRGVVGAYPELENGLTGFASARAAVPGDGSPRDRRATLSPTELAALASYWIGAGARIVGGCCGATPSHVRALRAAIDSLDAASIRARGDNG
jgi:S-methylmethionine-dependent homocysteine/selenocysteine methylase